MKIKNCALVGIILVLVPLAFAAKPPDLVYKTNLDIYKNNTVVLNSFEVVEGAISHFPSDQKPFGVSVFSGSQELFSKSIDVSFSLILDPPITGFDLEKQNVEMRLPYYRMADEIKIHNSGTEIFSINLKDEICNENGACELGENDYNCKADCGKKYGYWIFLIAIPVVLVSIFAIRKFSTRNKLKQENQNMNSGNEQRRSF